MEEYPRSCWLGAHPGAGARGVAVCGHLRFCPGAAWLRARRGMVAARRRFATIPASRSLAGGGWVLRLRKKPDLVRAGLLYHFMGGAIADVFRRAGNR